MMVRFEEDEYIAVAIFDAGDRIQTMNAMDEIFSYLDEDMKYLIFTTIQKLYYLRTGVSWNNETGRNARADKKGAGEETTT